ncbi:MAG: glycosyltransferase [Vicinamibacterales bacterium]
MTTPRYSIVIPTFRRGESLAECLESLIALDYPHDRLEVVIIDNGGPAEHTRAAAEPFMDRLAIRYFVNVKNRGYGFSVNRGLVESRGDRIVILNDDARPAVDLFRRCDELLDEDPSIGCVGCRAIEKGYIREGEGIGRLTARGDVVANFDVDCGAPIEVEHVYGFCYVFTREALDRAGLNDRTLLAQPYSSGNRIETDHCLSIRRHGLKVVYHPAMVATHLAKPRPDMSEVSLRWHLNAIRNTLYLYLKHFGPFGRGGAALRLTFLRDVGILSTMRRPSRANAAYFLMGLRARASAWGHWLKYLVVPGVDRPDAVRAVLEADAREAAAAGQASPMSPSSR